MIAAAIAEAGASKVAQPTGAPSAPDEGGGGIFGGFSLPTSIPGMPNIPNIPAMPVPSKPKSGLQDEIEQHEAQQLALVQLNGRPACPKRISRMVTAIVQSNAARLL